MFPDTLRHDISNLQDELILIELFIILFILCVSFCCSIKLKGINQSTNLKVVLSTPLCFPRFFSRSYQPTPKCLLRYIISAITLVYNFLLNSYSLSHWCTWQVIFLRSVQWSESITNQVGLLEIDVCLVNREEQIYYWGRWGRVACEVVSFEHAPSKIVLCLFVCLFVFFNLKSGFQHFFIIYFQDVSMFYHTLQKYLPHSVIVFHLVQYNVVGWAVGVSCRWHVLFCVVWCVVVQRTVNEL